MSGGHVNRDGSWSSGCIRGRGGRGFWTKVLKRPDGCWVWMGFLDKNGTGKFCTVVDGKVTSVRAPRYAWEQLVGPIPDGHVLLTVVCWNARCVNPAHRMAVPRPDVTRWLVALQRPYEYADNKGEMSGRAVLTEDAVLFVRAQGRIRGAVPLLARLYGVSQVTIEHAKYGRTWKHVVGRANVAETLSIKALRELVEQREEERTSRTRELGEAATARDGAAA